jgi:hypothetical protein
MCFVVQKKKYIKVFRIFGFAAALASMSRAPPGEFFIHVWAAGRLSK